MPKAKTKIRPFAQDFSGNSKTQQHFKDSTDVNNIVRHFVATGIDPYAERAQHQNFGFASSQQFTEAMQNVASIQSQFNELPSETRSGFANDPARWIDSFKTPEPPLDAVVETRPSQDVPEAPPAEPILAPKTLESEPN